MLKYLNAEQVETLISHLRGEVWLCAKLQWRAGLRVAEALDLRPRDVDLTDGTLTVDSGKGGRRRTVPLHPDLSAALYGFPHHHRRSEAAEPYIHLTRFAMYHRLKTAGIPGNHALRHSAARHWLGQGVPINVVQLWLGHSSLRTTTIYLGLTAADPAAMAKVR